MPTPETHHGPDPAGHGLTRHKGTRDTCTAPDCGPPPGTLPDGDEPIPYPTVRHQCPHCRRTWAHRGTAAAHIRTCWRNPRARACLTCDLYRPVEPDLHYNGVPIYDTTQPSPCAADVCDVHERIVHCPFWRPAGDPGTAWPDPADVEAWRASRTAEQEPPF